MVQFFDLRPLSKEWVYKRPDFDIHPDGQILLRILAENRVKVYSLFTISGEGSDLRRKRFLMSWDGYLSVKC